MDTVLKRTEFHGELTFVFRRQDDGSYIGNCDENPAVTAAAHTVDEARQLLMAQLPVMD